MDTTEPAESYVVAGLLEAFATDPRVNQLDVRVTLVGDKVFLTGSVPTAERREALSAVASEVVPDYEVHNQTRVDDLPTTTEAEQLQ